MTAIRTLLTVIVATALLGAALPAVEDARSERTSVRLDTTATRLADAAAGLVSDDDPVPTDMHGASRTVTVTVPSRSFVDASADYLSIGGLPNDTQPTTVGYRVAGQAPRRLETGVRFVTGEAPLVLTPGRHTLRLALVRTSAGVGVRVRLIESVVSGADPRSNASRPSDPRTDGEQPTDALTDAGRRGFVPR